MLKLQCKVSFTYNRRDHCFRFVYIYARIAVYYLLLPFLGEQRWTGAAYSSQLTETIQRGLFAARQSTVRWGRGGITAVSSRIGSA